MASEADGGHVLLVWGFLLRKPNQRNSDGTTGFRVRLDTNGGNNNNPQPTNVLWVGIDSKIDGKLDVFLDANFAGGGAVALGVRGAENGTNTFPSTTSISNTTYKTYALGKIEEDTPANFSYRAVNHLTDGGDKDDVTQATTGDPDCYLSFMIPLADIVSYLGSLSTVLAKGSELYAQTRVATRGRTTALN